MDHNTRRIANVGRNHTMKRNCPQDNRPKNPPLVALHQETPQIPTQSSIHVSTTTFQETQGPPIRIKRTAASPPGDSKEEQGNKKARISTWTATGVGTAAAAWTARRCRCRCRRRRSHHRRKAKTTRARAASAAMAAATSARGGAAMEGERGGRGGG